MRTVGVDLAISGTHQAVVMDEQGEFLGAPFRLAVETASLDDLVRRARRGAAADTPVQVVMEPTGLSWLPLASYWSQRGVTIHLVNTQQAAALHKVYALHAKSDRISAQVLARLPRVSPETLHPLQVASADYLSGQRWCKQQEELMQLSTAIKNRIQAWERGF